MSWDFCEARLVLWELSTLSTPEKTPVYRRALNQDRSTIDHNGLPRAKSFLHQE